MLICQRQVALIYLYCIVLYYTLHILYYIAYQQYYTYTTNTNFCINYTITTHTLLYIFILQQLQYTLLYYCYTHYATNTYPVLYTIGTGCSISCPSRTLTDTEYSSLNLQRRIAYWFSVLIGLCQILNLSILKRARQNIFVLCAVIGIFTMSLLIVIQMEVYSGYSEDSVCSSNASW